MAQARLTFTKGCVADLAASRISLQPSRQMQIWASEGYVSIDFAKRSLAMVQPSPALNLHRTHQQPFDEGARLTLKNDLAGRQLQAMEKDGNNGEQLTCGLQYILHIVRAGTTPRANAADRPYAVRVA